MITEAILVAVLIATGKTLTELGVEKKFIPLANIVLGVAFGIVFLTGENMQTTALYGLIVGLTANGTYDLTKITK